MAWAIGTLAAGCEQERTEIVVRVDSELAWGVGATVQSVVVSVRRSGGDGPLRDRRTIVLGTAAGQRSLPLGVGLLAGDDVATPVWIEALGCGGPNGCTAAQAVVAQRAVVRFTAGQTLELPLRLTAECVGATCASDEHCAVGRRCEPATRAQLDLRPFGGGVDPIATDAARPSDAPLAMDAPVATDVGADVGRAMDLGADAGPVMDAAVDVRLATDAGADAGRDAGLPPTDDGAVCPSGQVLCGSTCHSVQVDPRHCGGCGRACSSGQTCVAGVCTTPPPCPVGMRLIPAGMFEMGSTTVADEQPNSP